MACAFFINETLHRKCCSQPEPSVEIRLLLQLGETLYLSGVYSFFQCFSCFKAWNVSSLDLDGCPSLWVASRSGGAMFYCKGTEAHKRNWITFCQ